MTDTSKLLTILGKSPEQRKAKLSTMINVVADVGKASFAMVSELGEVDYFLVPLLLYYRFKEDDSNLDKTTFIEEMKEKITQDNVAELISELNKFYSINIPKELSGKKLTDELDILIENYTQERFKETDDYKLANEIRVLLDSKGIKKEPKPKNLVK